MKFMTTLFLEKIERKRKTKVLPFVNLGPEDDPLPPTYILSNLTFAGCHFLEGVLIWLTSLIILRRVVVLLMNKIKILGTKYWNVVLDQRTFPDKYYD